MASSTNMAETAERDLVAEATSAAIELRRTIESSEGSTPHFDILDGTLFSLLHTLGLLQSLPSSQSLTDLMGPLQRCISECRDALPVAQQTVFWVDIFAELSVILQGFSNTFMCFLFQHT
jgi:hypothetical protein